MSAKIKEKQLMDIFGNIIKYLKGKILISKMEKDKVVTFWDNIYGV